jgi:6-phosphogluconolactonase
MGDERYVPFSDKDSNWGAIMALFDASPELSNVKRISPDILATVEATALAYDVTLKALNIDRFDLVWVGVGEDGHTLSLFPENESFLTATEQWVVPVKNAPKPPSERISLSLKALEHVADLVIFATGAAKKDILRTARLNGGLPISTAAEVAELGGGEVRWLYDDAAWGER